MDTYDKIYVNTINGYMCSDYCVCPGIPTDPWVEKYRSVDEKELNKYSRT